MKNKKKYEEEMRRFETYNNIRVKSNCYFIVRLDGKRFSKLTTEMGLKKPFDYDFKIAIVKAIKKLMLESGSILGYTQSDEINILFDKTSCFFNRRIEKINSVLSSMMTAFCMEQEFFKNYNPLFDCRILVAKTKREVFNIFTWRQNDCFRNCLNSYAYWHLRFSGKTKKEAENILKNRKIDSKQKMLVEEFNLDFGDIKDWEKYGIYILWEKYKKKGFNPLEKKEVLVDRRRFKEVSREFENVNEFFKSLNTAREFLTNLKINKRKRFKNE